MGYDIISQEDIRLVLQKTKELYSKVEFLSLDKKILSQLEGALISDSISINADSDIRRTYTMELQVVDDTYLIGMEKRIWLNKYVKPYIGILNPRTSETTWYCLGVFNFAQASYTYDASTNKLSLSCNDLMSTLNDTANGQMEGLSLTVPSGSVARDVVIDTLAEVGITKYSIEGLYYEIPYDLEYSAGVSAYTIIKEIIDLYGGYEMFFDVDGLFTIQPIPTCEDDLNILDDSLLSLIVVSESSAVDFTQVYNHVQVWGQSIETDYYSEDVTLEDDTYIATVEIARYDDEDLIIDYSGGCDNFDKISLKLPETNPENVKININDFGAKAVVFDENDTALSAGKITENTVYTFRYRKSSDDFMYMGQYQCFGESIDENPDSPFSVDNLGYERVKVLSDGDYANIYTDSLCEQRADYELYLATNLQNTLTLNTVMIPWLNVNKKVEYTSYQSGETYEYIIKSISGSFSEGTMSMSMSRFYADFPDIVEITGLKETN